MISTNIYNPIAANGTVNKSGFFHFNAAIKLTSATAQNITSIVTDAPPSWEITSTPANHLCLNGISCIVLKQIYY